MSKPDTRPGNANFSSGPCTKHPGWRIADLAGAERIAVEHMAEAVQFRLEG